MYFDISTVREHAVAEYAGISLFQVQNLMILDFWALLHDAVVYNRAQTPDGRKWLKNAWRLTQTEPETAKLHKKYG